MNTEQRPKTEDFNEVIFIVLKMITYNRETDKLENEQVSLVFGPNFVLSSENDPHPNPFPEGEGIRFSCSFVSIFDMGVSFQERERDVFNPIRERIRKDFGRIRKMGADYLAYTLIDAIIDNRTRKLPLMLPN